MKVPIEIKQLGLEDLADFKALLNIFTAVFENEAPMAQDERLQKLLSNPDFLCFVISSNNQVLGGLTIYVLHSYLDAQPQAYIYDVGVHPDFQGQGLGQALMAEVGRYCQQKGFAAAYVEADSEDLEAIKFYRKTKFSSEMQAVHFTYTFAHEKQQPAP